MENRKWEFHFHRNNTTYLKLVVKNGDISHADVNNIFDHLFMKENCNFTIPEGSKIMKFVKREINSSIIRHFRNTITIFKCTRRNTCNGNCPCQNFRSKNSFKSDVALKHAPDERPVKKADQKSEIAPARDDEKRRRRKQSLEHGDVPIFGVCTT